MFYLWVINMCTPFANVLCPQLRPIHMKLQFPPLWLEALYFRLDLFLYLHYLQENHFLFNKILFHWIEFNHRNYHFSQFSLKAQSKLQLTNSDFISVNSTHDQTA